MLSILVPWGKFGDCAPYGIGDGETALFEGPLRRGPLFLGVVASGVRTANGLKGSEFGENADAGLERPPRCCCCCCCWGALPF